MRSIGTSDELKVIEILSEARIKVDRNYILDRVGAWGEIDKLQKNNGVVLREVIKNIRRKRLTGKKIILSDTNGYWISGNREEIENWIKRQRSRANEHLLTANTVEDHKNEIFGKGSVSPEFNFE